MLAEVRPSSPARATGNSEAWQRFEIEQRLQAPDALEQTPRARLVREINRIALRYGWTDPIVKALDAAGAAALGHLHEHELEALAAEMRRLVECAMSGCDLDDALPAR